MRPRYQIMADDNDITALVRHHFKSLSINDSSGLDSDSLTLNLSDPRGFIQWPRKNVRLSFWLGYQEEKLSYKGSYLVSELDYLSPPNELQIVSRAADIKTMSAQRRTRQWGAVTLGQVINVIAAEQGLIPAVSDQLAGLAVPDLWQMDETDLHFLSRLAETYQAIAQVKAGRLLLVGRGALLTVSGNTMPVFELHRNECGNYRYSERDSDEYDAIKVKYYDAERRLSTHQVGTGSRVYTLPTVYSSQIEAIDASNAAYRSLEAGASELSISLEHGQAKYISEAGVNLTGFIPRVNELDWVVKQVTHSLSPGLRTQLTLVRPMAYEADG